MRATNTIVSLEKCVCKWRECGNTYWINTINFIYFQSQWYRRVFLSQHEESIRNPYEMITVSTKLVMYVCVCPNSWIKIHHANQKCGSTLRKHGNDDDDVDEPSTHTTTNRRQCRGYSYLNLQCVQSWISIIPFAPLAAAGCRFWLPIRCVSVSFPVSALFIYNYNMPTLQWLWHVSFSRVTGI